MADWKHLGLDELQTGLELIRRSPRDLGVIELIVRRPRVDEREVLTEARLDLVEGLVGDCWRAKCSPHTANGAPDPAAQITIMNARAIALVAQAKARWPMAGDQIFIDLDLSGANLPAGSLLTLGSAILEVSAQPHTGCRKFTARFGLEAMKFVNSPTGRELNLRGINAKVVQPGIIRAGDVVRKT
jgi:hypothetical protein